jgi:hypothetical protein
VAGVDVRTHAGADDRDWLDGWRTGPLRTIADRDLPDAGRLDEARYCHSIMVDVPDPQDLGHLQAAWAVARWLVARGSFAVLDAHAHRWWDGTVLAGWSPQRPFTLDNEITFVAESEPAGGFGHAMHIRGLAKFARPDLITGTHPAAIGLMHQVMQALAARLAAGSRVAPGQVLKIDAGLEFTLAAYQPDINAPQVNLNNEAVLLVPA